MSCELTCCTCSRRCVRFEKLQLPPNNNDNRIALFPTPLLQSMACACTSEMHPCQDLVLQIAIGWWGNLAWTGSLSPDRAIIFLVGRYGSTENSSPESYEFLGLGAVVVDFICVLASRSLPFGILAGPTCALLLATPIPVLSTPLLNPALILHSLRSLTVRF